MALLSTEAKVGLGVLGVTAIVLLPSVIRGCRNSPTLENHVQTNAVPVAYGENTNSIGGIKVTPGIKQYTVPITALVKKVPSASPQLPRYIQGFVLETNRFPLPGELPFIVRSDHDLGVSFNTPIDSTNTYHPTFSGMVYTSQKITTDPQTGKPVTGVNINTGNSERALHITRNYTGTSTNNSPLNIATGIEYTLDKPLSTFECAGRKFGLVEVPEPLRGNQLTIPYFFIENPQLRDSGDLYHTPQVKGTVYQFNAMTGADYAARERATLAEKDTTLRASGFSH